LPNALAIAIPLDVPPLEPENPRLDLELFRFLLESTADQIYFKDRHGRFLRASRAVAEYMDVTHPEDLIGKTDYDFWSDETAKEAAADEQLVMATGQPLVGKIERLVHPDGRITWDYTTKMPLRDSDGNITGIVGINKDFTAIKKMEDALADERNRLRELTEELEQKNSQLEADIRMARDVQLALLPRDYPKITESGMSGHCQLSFAHHYHPAATVGGDFFDIFPLSSQRVGILICDVMGHGLRAALITAIIRTLLEELRPVMHNAGRFLNMLNLHLRAILERVEEPFVATACYVIVDTTSQEIQLSSAGHPAPIQLQRQPPTAALVPFDSGRPGPALGLFDDAFFATSRRSFKKDETLVLFTDGLYEAENPTGTQLGVKALVDIFARNAGIEVARLPAAVVADVQQFSQREDFEDDICIVAVERT
jgi:sigma-B regulation protein RsbU (phosphoserine phosphatase)